MRTTSGEGWKLMTETGIQDQARQQMRDRLASETTMEREARLHQMRVDQHNRLASEEREARL